jgi:alkaline phosphatase D
MNVRRSLAVAAVTLALFVAAVLAAAPARDARPVADVVFGSCLKDVEHPMLARTLTLPMDLFLFLGDNIYADTTDMAVMRARYDALKASAFFRTLRARVPILATWDDHDVGANDAGADYPKLRESKAEFLRWLDEPADSPRRHRDGVYDAHIFGPPGRRVQIILLDTRTFRSPLRRADKSEPPLLGGPYRPLADPAATMLGDAQWRWLRAQLQQPAEVRLIASSIQFVSEFSGGEAWANLPLEKQRLLDLLHDTRAAGVLFVSGDRHWCELSRMPGPTGYALHDLTASALTEKHPRGTPTPNRYRALEKTYHDVNVGHLRIDWSAADPRITWRIVDVTGATQLEHSLHLSELQPAGR